MALNLRRYKTGFDRVSIVAFIVVAAMFALIYVSVPEAYRPPDPDSEAGRALQAQLYESCGTDDSDPLVGLCRENILSKERWRYYRTQIDPLRIALLWLAVFGGAALFFGRWTWRWLAAGFRTDRTGE